MAGHSDQFRTFLRARLQETGIPMRQLSRAMGRDDSYVAQLLDPPPGRARPLPTPAELRHAAALLGVSYMQLVALAWDISGDDIERYYRDIATQVANAGFRWTDFTPAERDELLDYASYLLVRRSMRPLAPAAHANESADGQPAAEA
jgi:hypothetical protein